MYIYVVLYDILDNLSQFGKNWSIKRRLVSKEVKHRVGKQL